MNHTVSSRSAGLMKTVCVLVSGDSDFRCLCKAGLVAVSQRVRQRGELDPCSNQVVRGQEVSPPGCRQTVHSELITNRR